MKDRAYAKINLALDVFNKRDDGFHDINSIMIPINFYDELSIEISDADYCFCNKKYIKFNEHNSIIKMINEIKKRFDIKDHYAIHLNKFIPVQAGLGGGTSDAASTLRIFKKLYKLNLSPKDEKDICLSVGADVLFNYYNHSAVVSGIGDEIELFDVKKEYYVLIVKPKTGVSTKEAYQLLNLNICDHPNILALKKALINGYSINGLLGNSLEQPSFLLNKQIYSIKEELKSNGGRNVIMSGSGSSVFAISDDVNEIEKIYESVKNSEYYVRLTQTLTNK